MAFSSHVLLWLLYLVRVQSDDESGQAEVTSHTPTNAGNQPPPPPPPGDKDKLRWWRYPGDNWCESFELCCGKQQSPIALETKSAKPENSPIKFDNFDTTPSEITFSNGGQSILVQMKFPGKKPSVSGGGLNGTYEFTQSYFHWGKDDDRGSEHTVDGAIYPFEAQLMFTNSMYSNNALEIVKQNQTVFMFISTLFRATSVDNSLLHQITATLPSVKYNNSMVVSRENNQLKLTNLLPNSTDEFFRYMGSGSIPVCPESVQWIVFVQTGEISRDQLDGFRKLHVGVENDPGPNMVDNFRKPQPLNDRTVYLRGGHISGHLRDSALAANQHSLWIMLSAVLIIKLFR